MYLFVHVFEHCQTFLEYVYIYIERERERVRERERETSFYLAASMALTSMLKRSTLFSLLLLLLLSSPLLPNRSRPLRFVGFIIHSL